MLRDDQILKALQRPTGTVDVLLDTDTYNEIDDQFALAYMMKSPEKLNIVGITAAPFLNKKAASVGYRLHIDIKYNNREYSWCTGIKQLIRVNFLCIVRTKR